MQLDDLRAVGQGDSRALMDAVVREAIHDEQVAFAAEGGEHSDVGEGNAGKNERVFDVEPVSQAAFGLGTEGDTGKGPGRTVVRAPGRQGLDHGLLNALVATEAEKAVGAKIDDRAPENRSAAVIVHVVDGEVLEMDVSAAIEELNANAGDFVALQARTQSLHRGIGLRRCGALPI